MKKLKTITENDITEFIEQAKILRQSKYLQVTSSTKMVYKKGEGVKFESKMPERDDIEVILVRIRPFIEYNERLHVGRVITFLIEKYGSSELLQSFQFLFQPESENYPSITLNNKEYKMRDLLVLYMYGKYLHLDAEKQATYKQFEEMLGQMTEVFALSQIDRYIGIILGVAGYIIKNNLYTPKK